LQQILGLPGQVLRNHCKPLELQDETSTDEREIISILQKSWIIAGDKAIRQYTQTPNIAVSPDILAASQFRCHKYMKLTEVDDLE
jgi:hypothetical protein